MHDLFQISLFTQQSVVLILNRQQGISDGFANGQLEIAISLTIKFAGDFFQAFSGGAGINFH